MQMVIEMKARQMDVELIRPANHARKFPDRYSVYTQAGASLLLWSTSKSSANLGKAIAKAHESHRDDSVSNVVVFDGEKAISLHTQFHEL